MPLVSACLLGVCTRYDQRSKEHPRILRLAEVQGLVPICPEQLGGLPTPRPRARILHGDGLAVLAGKARVVDEQGIDRTENFVRGAQEVLRLARLLGMDKAYLKAKSPSCGKNQILGVTAALLLRNGINVIEIA